MGSNTSSQIPPVDREHFGDAVEFLLNPASITFLEYLLKDEVWKEIVAAAKLRRAKADALYGDLKELKRLMDMEGKNISLEDRLHRKKFIKEFPRVKKGLEENIAKLRALADEVDKVHRDCTITNVVASSTGAVSGILTIAGLALTPVTAGASLVLLATGAGLGAAAAVTGVSSGIVEHSKNVSAKAEACHLVAIGTDIEQMVADLLQHCIPQAVSLARECIPDLNAILKNARAFELLKANPSLPAQVKSFTDAGEIAAQGSRQLPKAILGSALAITKGGRVFGGIMSGAFILMDVINIVQEAKLLKEGSNSASAEDLRQQAQVLERKLEELTDTYRSQQEAEREDESASSWPTLST